jgi:LTXXQ motif family protein
MRKIGPFLAIAVFIASLVVPTESQAFGIRVGPFYVGVPLFWHRHWRQSGHATDLRDDASVKTGTLGQTGGLMSPLIYPVLALPTVYGEIFSPPSSAPPSSSWPFSYDAIFQAAFAKTASDQNAKSCPQLGGRPVIADRIKTEIKPTPDQMQPLQKLGGALGFASDYLAKACPTDIPQDPAARLQLMEWQIEKVAEALDFVRQPLQEFEGSLTDAQRTRFAPPSTAAAAIHPDRANIASDCAAAPTKVDSSIEQISLSIEPTDAQRDSMNNLKQAFRNAASELDANCPVSSPADPLARLEAIQARLDATWRALVSIQTALAGLEKNLNDDQRARLYATDFAAVQ